MNVLFVYSQAINPQFGGVERVTHTLANYFDSNGCKSFFLGAANSLQTDDPRQHFLPDRTTLLSIANISFVQDFLKKYKIDVVVNQGGTNPELTKLACGCKSFGVKVISVVHNSLLGPVNNFKSINKVRFDNFGVGWLLSIADTKLIKCILFNIYKWKYSSHYKYLCGSSDWVFLLSQDYIDELSFFIGGMSVDNVIGMPNPLSFEEVVENHKRKEVLYVGRINCTQKRIDLLLKIWSMLEPSYKDWTLKIVGDGEELKSIKNLCAQLKLDNVKFYGFCDPRPFYETAAVFTMTSSFEGFPLTLLESMQYGVVPIAFNSFVSAKEIIDDKKNGFLINPFDINDYAQTLSKLMSSNSDREEYSISAMNKVKQFDLSVIGAKWLEYMKK